MPEGLSPDPTCRGALSEILYKRGLQDYARRYGKKTASRIFGDSSGATVNQLPPAPTPQQLLGLGAEIQSTVTAAQELSSATESACE